MFDMRDVGNDIFNSIEERFNGIFHTANMDLPIEAVQSISSILHDLFTPSSQGSASGVFKKTPANLGDKDNSRGIFNVIPSTNITNRITDTLVVYCLGNDNLYDRLVDTMIEVGKYNFMNVIFVTSKWDISALTGKNIQRLRDLKELQGVGASFCFILVSTCGICHIPVV